MKGSDMGESGNSAVRLVESRWTYWSHRVSLVCLAGGLLLAPVLLVSLGLSGFELPPSVFRKGFYAALGLLLIWIATSVKGVDVRLPEARPPLTWLSSILLFILIALRYVLLIETGLFGFLAFPSQWRYLGLFAAAFGALGILKGLGGAMAARRAELRQLL